MRLYIERHTTLKNYGGLFTHLQLGELVNVCFKSNIVCFFICLKLQSVQSNLGVIAL